MTLNGERDWLILMVCEHVWGYSMPRGYKIIIIVYFLCHCFLRHFKKIIWYQGLLFNIIYMWLYGFKYSYLILMIIEFEITILFHNSHLLAHSYMVSSN